VALIYLAYIDRKMHDHSFYKDYTLQDLLDELDVIERFEYPGHQSHSGEVTKKQTELFKLLGVDAPA